MKLVTVKEFVSISGVTKQAIYSHLRKGERLQYYKGSNQIDIEAPLTQAYLNNVPAQRLRKTTEPPDGVLQMMPSPQLDTYIPENAEDIANAVEKYSKHRAEKEKQTADKLRMANEVRRGQLLEKTIVEEYIFLWIDRLHSNLDRMAGGFWDDLIRRVLLAGENKPEFKLEWKDRVKLIEHETKLECMERLTGIKKIQAER
jgi:hypothetical protein